MGPVSTIKCFKFVCNLKQKNNSALTESTQSDKKFEYLGEFDFIFETNLGYETGDPVGAFDEKNRSQKSRASVPLIA
jgi:hypothetical protein